jgi:predicted deacylase
MVERPHWIEPSVVLTSPATGTWYPTVRPDEYVTKGALFGRVMNYFGDIIAEVRSPMDGMVLYVVAGPAIGEGEPLGMVGVVTVGSATPA